MERCHFYEAACKHIKVHIIYTQLTYTEDKKAEWQTMSNVLLYKIWIIGAFLLEMFRKQ